MLDLKAKLLKAGLVTEEQVQKVESDEASARARGAQRSAASAGSKKPPKGKKGRSGGGARDPGADDDERWQRRVLELKEAPKSDQYDAIRGWVQRTRLDSVKGLPGDDAERFHFTKHDGHISWLTLEPDLKAALSDGQAGIIAFMSHNGLAHCVVPRAVALDVGTVRPDWVRHLDGFEVETKVPGAGANDAGANDAGANDAGANDAGANDAGANDAGANDAGANDAGANDAGANDAADEATGSGPSAASPPPAAT